MFEDCPLRMKATSSPKLWLLGCVGKVTLGSKFLLSGTDNHRAQYYLEPYSLAGKQNKASLTLIWSSYGPCFGSGGGWLAAGSMGSIRRKATIRGDSCCQHAHFSSSQVTPRKHQ